MRNTRVEELELEAEIENLDELQDFVDDSITAAGCSVKTQMQIHLAVEEIFANIANYAYAPNRGSAGVRVEVSEEPAAVTITFRDHGIPYDPTAKADPDVTLEASEREIGGLGIFITKKVMDEVAYEYRDGENVLTMKKYL